MAGIEKIRAAIGAGRFAIARIMQGDTGACLCDRASQKAARVVQIVMIDDRVCAGLVVGNRVIGASPGESPPLGLPCCVKGKPSCRVAGLLLDRHGQRQPAGPRGRRVRRLRGVSTKQIGACRQPCGRRKRPRHNRPVDTLSRSPSEMRAMTPPSPACHPPTRLRRSGNLVDLWITLYRGAGLLHLLFWVACRIQFSST
jgi:hypothetical protein